MAAAPTERATPAITVERALPWAAAVMWGVLPVLAGPAFDTAIHPHSGAVRAVASVGLWAGWAAGLVAALIPHPIGLTVFRLAAPTGIAAAALTAAGRHPANGAKAGIATAAAVVAAALAFAPAVGERAVNGPAYANEHRAVLRPPGGLLLGPLLIAWALTVGLPVAAALLFAAARPVPGAIVTVLAIPVTAVLGRSIHGLSRRWLVFVPAGVVLHDLLSLGQPVLFPRRSIESLRPAPADSDSLDLTQKAFGLTLELLLLEKIPMTLQRPGKKWGEEGASARLLFTPTRPGRVLAEARARSIPVG